LQHCNPRCSPVHLITQSAEGPDLHGVYATGRFLRGFPLKEPVDSTHLRQNLGIELKNRRIRQLPTPIAGTLGPFDF
jgi:hypothetical protein